MLTYSSDRPVTAHEFKDLLLRSTLGERRPVEDDAMMQGMIENSNLITTCWDRDLLVGISRSVTDFHYCCYVSDLAVDVSYQRKGIGKKLIEETSGKVRDSCTIILLSAPAAVDFYPHIGFKKHPQAWVL
ncbi:MAG: GNAT family N-acetyltransferase [Verrucomicrobiales bacterium]|nr:GNAT family N-acetyltransferase [Verrucomicrobiales bacterium]